MTLGQNGRFGRRDCVFEHWLEVPFPVFHQKDMRLRSSLIKERVLCRAPIRGKMHKGFLHVDTVFGEAR